MRSAIVVLTRLIASAFMTLHLWQSAPQANAEWLHWQLSGNEYAAAPPGRCRMRTASMAAPFAVQRKALFCDGHHITNVVPALVSDWSDDQVRSSAAGTTQRIS